MCELTFPTRRTLQNFHQFTTGHRLLQPVAAWSGRQARLIKLKTSNDRLEKKARDFYSAFNWRSMMAHYLRLARRIYCNVHEHYQTISSALRQTMVLIVYKLTIGN